jgi:Cof subfamily protein (haloacid dehalogenase superfamily)
MKPDRNRPDHYRLVAIDLDGTLLCPKGTVTPRTRAAVQKAVMADIRICFATGRSWRESHRILKEAGHFDSAVFVTGALVIDTRRRKTIHRRLMGPDLAREVSQFFQERGQTVLALQDSQQAGVDYLVTEGSPLSSCTREWVKMARSRVHRHTGLAGADAHAHTLRVSIVAESSEVERCRVDLLEVFGPRVAWQDLVVPSTGARVLEVFDPAVNKWAGVLHVAARHGIERHQIVAVGDDANDVPMIRDAGLGVAMGNARQPALAAAKRVIGHNRDDGLAEFLEELVDRQA